MANSKPFIPENKTASELAQDFLLDAGVSEGWNEDKGFFISIGSSVFEEADPSTNPNFLNIRAMKAFEANITAKGDIISYIRTTMSAEDLITVPSSGLSTEFDEKKYNLELKLQSKIRKYKKAAINYDKTLSNNFNNMRRNIYRCCNGWPAFSIYFKIRYKNRYFGQKKAEDLKKAEAELFLALESEINSLKTSKEIARTDFTRKHILCQNIIIDDPCRCLSSCSFRVICRWAI